MTGTVERKTLNTMKAVSGKQIQTYSDLIRFYMHHPYSSFASHAIAICKGTVNPISMTIVCLQQCPNVIIAHCTDTI